MQIPGLLVEYLINGAVALTWLLPLMASLGLAPDANKISTEIILLLVPGLYVLGMIIDTAAEFFIKSRKNRIKEIVYKEHISNKDLKKMVRTYLNPKLILYAPELAKAVQIRSSIDRIARSTFLNVVLLTLVVTFKSLQMTNGLLIPSLLLVTGGMLSVFCLKMWSRFQHASYAFKISAFRVLEEKLDNERIGKQELSDETDIIQHTIDED